MKTLIITPQYLPQVGGIPSFVSNMIQNWPQPDNTFVIYTPPAKNSIEYDKTSNIKIYRGEIKGMLGMLKIYRLSRKENIDMIHLHSPHILTRLTQYIFTKYVNKKYKLFFHSIDFNYFKQDQKKRKRIARLIINADKVIVNSNYLKDKFSEIFGEIAKDIVVIYPCPSNHFFEKIPNEELTTLKKKLALDGKKVILTVARLDEGKGFPRLIDTLPNVLKIIPNLVWLIVGDGKKKLEFINLISKNGMQNIIRYIGNVDHLELKKYYQLADVFVLFLHPDEKAEEDWATVFLEASASGLPIITGTVGGIEEQVHDLKTGLIIDVDNREQAGQAIIELLSNPDKAKDMGEYGRAWVKQEFNWIMENNKLI